MAQPAQKIPALDGIRGWAVLIVFFYHYGGGAQSHFLPLHILGLIDKLGWSGVSLFFVLSGFLITGILWDAIGQKHWWRNFYIRRALRIFPLYYFSIFLVVLAAAITGNFRQVLSNIWVWMLYLQNVVPLIKHQAIPLNSPVLIGHFWTLAVEEQFYLVWPFVLLAAKKRETAKNLCIAAILLSLAYRLCVVFYSHQPSGFCSLVFGRAGEFCSGGWLALAMRGPERITVLKKSFWGIGFGSFCILGAIVFMPHQEFILPGEWLETAGYLGTGVFSAGIIAASFQDGLVRCFAEKRCFVETGKISYGIYIYHILPSTFYHFLGGYLLPHASRNLQLVVTACFAALGTWMIAWLSYRYFESPFLRLKIRFSSQPDPDKTYAS